MTEITDLVSQEKAKLTGIRIDQTVICGVHDLPSVYRLNLPRDKQVPKRLVEVYASPLIFYPHSEDLNYTAKIRHLNEQGRKISCCTANEVYSEDDAEIQYLSSNPVSFLILGKPDIGETELARLLADYWKCVFISPKSVIDDEIALGTAAGKYVEHSLANGRSIGPDILLSLVEKRIKSETAKHRGYVICGFPVLPNIDDPPDSTSSQSTICVAQEIYEDLLPADEKLDTAKMSVSFGENLSDSEGSTHEINKSKIEKQEKQDENEQEDLDVGSRDFDITAKSNSSLVKPSAQVEFLFSLFNDPFVIIYIMCDDLDVIKKRCKLEDEFVATENLEEECLSSNKSQNLVKDDAEKNNNATSRSHVSIEVDSKKNVSSQLYQFHVHVHPIIEQKILNHDPKYFIKVDGRLSPAKIFHALRSRLKTLAFQPVLIPQKLWDDDEMTNDLIGEGGVSKVQSMDVEQSYNKLRSRLVIGDMYKWQLSNWCFKCPVASKEGKIQTGNPKLAVQFMNKIYYLSNQESFLKFYRNPRSYLLPGTPSCPGRIWIMGPKLAGKTIIAKCLSILFDYKILDLAQMEENYRKRRKNEYTENVRSAATVEALKFLHEKDRENREEQKEEWMNKANELIKKVCAYYISLIPKDGSGVDTNVINIVETQLRSELESMKLPSMSNTDLIVSLEDNLEKISEYMPSELREGTPADDVSDPFVVEFVENAVQECVVPDINMELKDKIEMFKVIVRDIENDCFERYGRRGGWIINGMPANVEFIKALGPEYLADDIICLRDDDPENKFPLTKFAKEDYTSFCDFKSLFVKMSKIAESDKSHISDSKIDFINYLLGSVHNIVFSHINAPIDEPVDDELLKLEKNSNIDESASQLNEDWTQTLNYLKTEGNRTPIEIMITHMPTYHLLRECIVLLENRYRRTASVVTEEDRIQERKDFGGTREKKLNVEYGEEHAAEDDGKEAENFFAENRRFGDTANYCPDAFNRYNVLWKGREDLAARFEEKLYFFSTQQSLDKFLEYPPEILQKIAPKQFPPPRICIIGVEGSGKTTLARNLARNFGLHYVDYQSFLLASLNLSSLNVIECVDDDLLPDDLARRVPVPDARFDYLCNYYKPASKVPAFLNIVDIAGLVKGASEGQGLGNAFLSHISACDAIFHLCRAFDDDDVTHVEGDVNPVRDLEIIFEELRLKDEEQLLKSLEKLERTVGRGADKKMKPEYDALLKVKTVLVDEKNHIRFADWNTNDIEILNRHLFLTSKPGIYLINLSEKDYIRKKNKWLAKIKEWVDKHDPGSIIIPFSGVFEHKLVEMEDEAERAKYLQEVGATSALDKIIVQGYKALQLEYFFTSGTDEVKAWTIQKGTKAPQAAGKIHTDFEKGFIMAEVMKYVDFKEEGSESGVKAAGKYRQQGRNYTVEDGDIIFFKFNAGAGIKDGKKK